MDADDMLAQDLVAKQWIEEIDSFKSPPPPRRLQDLNFATSTTQEHRHGDGLTTALSTQHSRDGSYSTDSGRQMTEEMPQENFIVDKVKQFEDNHAHPYANHRRIETSKKIAVQGGGGLASFLINDKSKQRISKEESSKLRASVLQENRVYNPYPGPYSGADPPTNKDISRRNDPSNSSGGSGSSSLISQAKDSSSSWAASVNVSGVISEGGKANTSNSQQRSVRLPLHLRPHAQRPCSASSTLATASAAVDATSRGKPKDPMLFSPSATSSSSALLSPRDDRFSISSSDEHRFKEQRSSNGKSEAREVIYANNTRFPNGGRNSLTENSTSSNMDRNLSALDRFPTRSSSIPAGTTQGLAPKLQSATSVDDEEMANIYKNFDAELKNLTVRQQQKPVRGQLPSLPTDALQPPIYGQHRKQRPLPPYTGIREQTSLLSYSESPLVGLPPAPPPKNSTSSAAASQQQSRGQSQTNEQRSVTDFPGRIPVRPSASPVTETSMAPPVPVRQASSNWRQQQHYDVPNKVGIRPLHNGNGENFKEGPGVAMIQENGYQTSNASINGVPPAPPPPPPPPPTYSAVRRYGGSSNANRIPDKSTPSPLPQPNRSHGPYGERLNNNAVAAEGLLQRYTKPNGTAPYQQSNTENGHAGSVPPPPFLRLHEPRANSFSGASNSSAVDGNGDKTALDRQLRMWNDLEREVVSDLERKAVPIGLCEKCGVKITNPLDGTQALGHLYHAHCFTCCYCERPLKGKKFYEARGKIYCEEDYLYSGFQHSAERCAVCGHLIMEMILQAIGKSFHPNCFKCNECRRGLENVPFTVDDQGLIYCIDDYHRLFAPRCAKCGQPITPTSGREETVRVVAMQRDYHIDCYACEGCGLRLTDEDEKRCYPLGDHLLCQRCHIHWSRTGGVSHPITDL